MTKEEFRKIKSQLHEELAEAEKELSKCNTDTLHGSFEPGEGSYAYYEVDGCLIYTALKRANHLYNKILRECYVRGTHGKKLSRRWAHCNNFTPELIRAVEMDALNEFVEGWYDALHFEGVELPWSAKHEVGNIINTMYVTIEMFTGESEDV